MEFFAINMSRNIALDTVVKKINNYLGKELTSKRYNYKDGMYFLSMIYVCISKVFSAKMGGYFFLFREDLMGRSINKNIFFIKTNNVFLSPNLTTKGIFNAFLKSSIFIKMFVVLTTILLFFTPNLLAVPSDTDQITDVISQLQTGIQNKNIEQCLNCFSVDFKTEYGDTIGLMEDYFNNLFQNDFEYIVSDIDITVNDNTAIVTDSFTIKIYLDYPKLNLTPKQIKNLPKVSDEEQQKINEMLKKHPLPKPEEKVMVSTGKEIYNLISVLPASMLEILI